MAPHSALTPDAADTAVDAGRSGADASRGAGDGSSLTPGRMLVGVAVLAIAGLIAAGATMVWHAHQAALDGARRDLIRTDLLLARQLERVFQAIDLVLAHVQLRIGETEGEAGRGETGHQLLENAILATPMLARVSLYDAGGRMAAISTGTPPPVISVEDRSYFTYHHDHRTTETLIGAPVVSRVSGERVLPLSRRLTGKSGTFQGVVLATVGLDALRRILADANLGDQGAASLVHKDFTLLAREPWPEAGVGQTLEAAPLYREVYQYQRARDGFGEYPGNFDRQPRLMATRALEGYPLIVTVSLPRATVLASWREQAWQIAGAVAAMVALLATLVLLLARQLALREAGKQRLAAANHELLAGRDRLRLILEASSDGLWEWNFQTRQLQWSDRLFDLLGYRRGNLAADFETLKGLVHPEDLPEFLAALRRHVDQGQAYRHEFRLRHRDGSWIWVLDKGRVLRDDAGAPLMMVGATTNISVHKALERTLTEVAAHKQAEAARVQGILDHVLDAVLVADHLGRIEAFNPAAERLFGYSAEEAVGHSINLLMPPDVGRRHDQFVAAFLNSGRRQIAETVLEARGRRRDGSVFPFELSLGVAWNAAIGAGRSDQPQPLFIACIRDITQRKRAEAELREARTQAELALRAKTEFLALMSHELRTPLNAVIGFSDLLASEAGDQMGPAQRRDFAGHILDSGRHLLALIDEVLEMSRLSSGEYELHPEPLHPEDLIETELAHATPAAVAAGVTLSETVKGVLPAINADRRALQQVLGNLVSNAIKYTPAGGRVTISGEPNADGGLMLAVADTGIGIPPGQGPALFQPFQQGDGSRTRRHGGTGLGLALVKKLVELHGATIRVDSTPGEGSIFTVTFPAARVVRDADPGLVIGA